MGEDHGRIGPAHGWLFEPSFNRSIKLRAADPRITSDAGALLLREADHRLGLTADLAARLIDPRRADRIRYTQVELLRQHIYATALGYPHQDHADTLAHDVAMKLAVWDRPSRQVAIHPAVMVDGHAERLPATADYWFDLPGRYRHGASGPRQTLYDHEVRRFMWFVQSRDYLGPDQAPGGGGGGGGSGT